MAHLSLGRLYRRSIDRLGGCSREAQHASASGESPPAIEDKLVYVESYTSQALIVMDQARLPGTSAAEDGAAELSTYMGRNARHARAQLDSLAIACNPRRAG